MKLLGKDKKNRRIVLLTEFEWETLLTALFEYKEASEWSEADPREIAKLTTVRNRIAKAENQFEALKFHEDKKLIDS